MAAWGSALLGLQDDDDGAVTEGGALVVVISPVGFGDFLGRNHGDFTSKKMQKGRIEARKMDV